jgi:hypothetical protein
MRPEIYILTISLPLLAAIVGFAMKYASSYAAARARQAEQSEIRALVETEASQLAQVLASLRGIEAEAARQSRSLAGVEAY